jgi:hypothetical protein
MSTLEDLKQENAQEEDSPTIIGEEEKTPEDQEESQNQEESQEPEDWAKPEDDDSGFVPDATAANIRRKYKAQAAEAKAKASDLEKRLEETARELEELKKARTAPAKILDKPARDAFDTDDEYFEALTDWKLKIARETEAAESSQKEKARQQEEVISRVQRGVDDHYTRVAKLSETAGIAPEAFQAADLKVRQAIDTVFPDAGDDITDALISQLGEGSERVFYNLGVNTKRLSEFIGLLKEDKNGLKASVYLGKLSAQLQPIKRESRAPDPMDEIKGDRSGGDSAGHLKKAYQEAHKNGDINKAFNLKRQAKKDGIDVKGW